MADMKSGDTTVGSMLSAMIFQIEEQNKKNVDPIDKQQMAILKKGSSMMIPSKLLNARSSNHLISVNGDAGEQGEESQRAKLMADLDDMYNKISVEQAVVQTDYSHVFAEKKVDDAMA